MIITKKALPRRTFLRGIGASMALPLLNSMVPALVAASTTAAQSPTRLSFVYVPNGMIMNQWTPKVLGSQYELTKIMEPLAPFRDDMLVLSGLAHNTGWALEGEGPGEHARASATFLTAVHPKKTEGADLRAGYLDRPDRGQGIRQTHSTGLPRASPGLHRSGGHLRYRL